MRRALLFVIVALAVGGIGDSTYMTLRHFDAFPLDQDAMMGLCNLYERANCETVERSNEATVLGVPTSLIGAGYFAVILAAVIVRLRRGRWPLAALFEALLAIGLFFSGYLVWVLLFELGIPCPFCLAAHAANAAIVILYAISHRLDEARFPRPGRWALRPH